MACSSPSGRNRASCCSGRKGLAWPPPCPWGWPGPTGWGLQACGPQGPELPKQTFQSKGVKTAQAGLGQSRLAALGGQVSFHPGRAWRAQQASNSMRLRHLFMCWVQGGGSAVTSKGNLRPPSQPNHRGLDPLGQKRHLKCLVRQGGRVDGMTPGVLNSLQQVGTS